jgi:UDP-N-acetyl-D-glucosamine dehydrogenase
MQKRNRAGKWSSDYRPLGETASPPHSARGWRVRTARWYTELRKAIWRWSSALLTCRAAGALSARPLTIAMSIGIGLICRRIDSQAVDIFPELVPSKHRLSMNELYSSKKAVIGIIGLGYVGMPLARAAWTAGFRVIGFDIDPAKAASINAGESYLRHIPKEEISAAVSAGRLRATTSFEEVRNADAIIICVPTPLTSHREPDLTYIENTAEAISPHLRTGHLIVLESTTWPGTTAEVMRPILERGGMKAGRDFYLAFSPEREDPGNISFSTKSIPKVVGADDPIGSELANTLYSAIVTKTIPVSSTRTAEAVKLTENIFRAVNIALVNELKVVYDAMGIDIWEVIEAAKSKPFGFMPFYPGPGLGGHCIPIDPFYLTWKAREFDISTRFIELAGEVNASMPSYVVEKLSRGFDERTGRGLLGAKILMIGIAYKKNVEDIRGSPGFKLIQLLEARGAVVDFHDPYVSKIPLTREHPKLAGRASVAWEPKTIGKYDAVLIATDHDNIDYRALCDSASFVVDTRNVCSRAGVVSPKVVKA